MIHSRAFGLHIHSDEALPGVPETESASAPSDRALRIRFDRWPDAVEPGRTGIPWPNPACADISARDVCVVGDGRWLSLVYDETLCFFVRRDGGEVSFVRPASMSIDEVATYLLGPIIGLVLRLRGVACLHASAVGVGDGVVCLVGPSESGKSTTAAALVRMGHSLVTDDISAVDLRDGVATVRPGAPRIRLWPGAVAKLVAGGADLPPLMAGWDKRYLDVPPIADLRDDPQPPLVCICLLGDRVSVNAPRIERVAARDALVSLVANSYGNLLLDERMRQQEFATLSTLARATPTFRLVPSDDPARLVDACALVIERARSNAAEAHRRATPAATP